MNTLYLFFVAVVFCLLFHSMLNIILEPSDPTVNLWHTITRLAGLCKHLHIVCVNMLGRRYFQKCHLRGRGKNYIFKNICIRMNRAWDCAKCWASRYGTEKCCIQNRPILARPQRSSVFPFSRQALLHELGFCGQCFSQCKLWMTGNIYNLSLTWNKKKWLILSWKQYEKKDKYRRWVSERTDPRQIKRQKKNKNPQTKHNTANENKSHS